MRFEKERRKNNQNILGEKAKESQQ